MYLLFVVVGDMVLFMPEKRCPGFLTQMSRRLPPVLLSAMIANPSSALAYWRPEDGR